MAQQLKRTVGLGGALLLGLGSMVGTGVFVALGLAAGIGGVWLLPAILIAGLLATCNGLSSAQLAAAHPVAGGSYAYGRQYLNNYTGFIAGWFFLIAKSASAAAAAMGVVAYVGNFIYPVQGVWVSVVAALVALALGMFVMGGLRRSNTLNSILVAVTVVALACFIIIGLSAHMSSANISFTALSPTAKSWWHGLAEATALVFVAYTGYGRVATMGEEIQNPQKNIPRAVIITLFTTITLYFLVALTAIGWAGVNDYARWAHITNAPLSEIAQAGGYPWLGVVLTVGAGLALLGVLLNLILGLSRTLLAMGRSGDMPQACGRVNAAGTTPVVAVPVMTLVIVGLVFLQDLALIWNLSAVTVLIYYAIANACALAQPAIERRYPRVVSAFGLLVCVGLIPFLPLGSLLSAAGLLVLGSLWFVLRGKVRRRLAATS